MMTSSPTTAALLRASPNPPSASSSAPRPLENNINPGIQQQQQQQTETGSCSSPEIELLRTTFKRQTVDAGTQYSRPTTPSRAVSLPSSKDAAASASGGLGQQASSHMPGTSIGSKRNTPDVTKVPAAAPGPSSGPSSAPSRQQQQQHPPPPQQQQQQQPQQRQQSQRRQQLEDEDRQSEGSASKRLRPTRPPVKLLPRRYEAADPRDLVVLISSMIMELIHYNDQIPLRDGRLTRFHSRSPPRISVQDYLQRLTTHATLSPPILLSMVYYIDRLCALYPAFTISSLTVHRFLISSATVASKGLSDSFWTNKTYARVGGISVEELALLELEFLWRVEWRIVPQPEVLVDYYLSLVERCEDYEIQPEAPPATAPVAAETGPTRPVPATVPATAPASTAAPSVTPAPATAPSVPPTSSMPITPSVPTDSKSKPKPKPGPGPTAKKPGPDAVQSKPPSSS
ncbi:Pho80p cyclin [Microsporum ferrugineum]